MSRERRFYVPELGPTVSLPANEAHHLLSVLRLGEGAEVTLFDGKGNAARAVVDRIAGNAVTLRVLSAEASRESPLALTIALAVPKGDRMSLAVRELTELGVRAISPLKTDRSAGAPTARSLARWRRIAVAASKQCGRSLVPSIEPRTVDQILEDPAGLVLLAAPGAAPLTRDLRKDRALLALVGPEGGWSERELALARSRSSTLFGLGPRTLRIETAAVAVAGLLQWLRGDFGDS